MNEKEYLKFINRSSEYEQEVKARNGSYQEQAFLIFDRMNHAIDEHQLMLNAPFETLAKDAQRNFELNMAMAAIHLASLIAEVVKQPRTGWKNFDNERGNVMLFKTAELEIGLFTVARGIIDGKYSSFAKNNLCEALGHLFAIASKHGVEIEPVAYSIFTKDQTERATS